MWLGVSGGDLVGTRQEVGVGFNSKVVVLRVNDLVVASADLSL